ncbi:hypothetical protein I3760_05G251300 [Carya illinoinensis]|nr:hypothetical protein I3760_05G251300 [Carya illinoinensis]
MLFSTQACPRHRDLQVLKWICVGIFVGLVFIRVGLQEAVRYSDGSSSSWISVMNFLKETPSDLVIERRPDHKIEATLLLQRLLFYFPPSSATDLNRKCYL